MLSPEINNQLDDLIQINIDSGDGYRFAASAVSDADLQRIFNESSAVREKFAAQLQELVARRGGDPEDDGSLAAVLHRTWLTFKADITTRNATAVVEECMRGDEESLELYEDVLQENDLPNSIKMLVEKQHGVIKDTLRQLSEWKTLFENRTVDV